MSSEASTVTEGEILSHAIETIGQSRWRQLAPVLGKLALPDRDLDRVDCLLEKTATLQSRTRNVPSSINTFAWGISSTS